MEHKNLSDVAVLVKTIITCLVDCPQAVQLEEIRGSQAVVLEVRVAPEDQGKVIGRQGRTVQALRDLLVNIGARTRHRYLLNILGHEALFRLSSGLETESASELPVRRTRIHGSAWAERLGR